MNLLYFSVYYSSSLFVTATATATEESQEKKSPTTIGVWLQHSPKNCLKSSEDCCTKGFHADHLSAVNISGGNNWLQNERLRFGHKRVIAYKIEEERCFIVSHGSSFSSSLDNLSSRGRRLINSARQGGDQSE